MAPAYVRPGTPPIFRALEPSCGDSKGRWALKRIELGFQAAFNAAAWNSAATGVRGSLRLLGTAQWFPVEEAAVGGGAKQCNEWQKNVAAWETGKPTSVLRHGW